MSSSSSAETLLFVPNLSRMIASPQLSPASRFLLPFLASWRLDSSQGWGRNEGFGVRTPWGAKAKATLLLLRNSDERREGRETGNQSHWATVDVASHLTVSSFPSPIRVWFCVLLVLQGCCVVWSRTECENATRDSRQHRKSLLF